VGQTAEEVRREIERTRNDMGYTLDAMGDRISPRRMVERRTNRVKGALRTARESVMGSASGATGRVSGLASSAGGGVHGAGSAVAGGAESALEMAKSAPQMARRQAEGNPLAAGLVAFGAGMLLGSLMPESQVEQKAAAAVVPQLEPLKEEAQHLAQDLKEGAGGVASETAATLKEHATGVGDQLKEQASQTKAQVSGQTG
jgi:hypothetical protein